MVVRTEEQTMLADALESHGYDDWFAALLHASIMESGGDAQKAVEIANEAFAKNPKDVSKPQEDDADAVFQD